MDTDLNVFEQIQRELESDTEGKGLWLSSLQQKCESLSCQLTKISDSLESNTHKGLFTANQSTSYLLAELSSSFKLPTIVSEFSETLSKLIDYTLVKVISHSNSKRLLARSLNGL